MRLRNTAIALGIGAAAPAGLTLLKVNKNLVVDLPLLLWVYG
tara:strand:+ start:760 stop:885 length:126 start_codon:yes stop_codon:yes gene_type:complete